MPDYGTSVSSVLSRNWKGFALGLAVLATAFTAAATNPAQAAQIQELQVGQCGTPQAVVSHLKAEGHGFVANMNAELIDKKQNKWVYLEQLYTATPDGAHWYQFQGNASKGQSTRLCVIRKGTDFQINDNHDNTNPPTVKAISYDRKDALKLCVSLWKKYGTGLVCNDLNTMLDGLQKKLKQNVMFQGHVIMKNGDTSTMITVIADPANQNDYSILSTNIKTGATLIAESGREAQFSPRVLAEIQKRK